MDKKTLDKIVLIVLSCFLVASIFFAYSVGTEGGRIIAYGLAIFFGLPAISILTRMIGSDKE